MGRRRSSKYQLPRHRYILLRKTSVLLLATLLVVPGYTYEPYFSKPLPNITIPVGRDVIFRCIVEHLGGYRVGWVKSDTKAIQAIHDRVVTHNPRIAISHGGHVVWNLHIRNVKLEDGGEYMCQINTNPMKSQVGALKVVIPPDFIYGETSGDLVVREGTTATLTCKAAGIPPPRIYWQREDGNPISYREPLTLQRMQVKAYPGETLQMVKISRFQMGVYLCIAANTIQPAISRRMTINVSFPPIIHVPNQLVGAPLLTDVKLECIVEASPRAINYWTKDGGGMVLSDYNYEVLTSVRSTFEVHMILIIHHIRREHMGSYHCNAKNSLGEVESNLRISEISEPPYFYNIDQEDDLDTIHGSAERDSDIDSNRSPERRRPQLLVTAAPPKGGILKGNARNSVSFDILSGCEVKAAAITSFTIVATTVSILGIK